MRFGIIAALKPEARAFQHARGQLYGGHEYVLLTSGPGRENACRATTQLAQESCDIFVSWGVAGALAPRLKAGDLVVGAEVIDDAGGKLVFDEAVARSVLSCIGDSAHAVFGSVLTVKDAAASAAAKADLFERYGADAVDLESCHIAHIARKANRQFICIRAIVDDSTFAVPEIALNGLDESGNMRALQTLIGVLQHPSQLPQLLRLARHFSKSINALKLAASRLTI